MMRSAKAASGTKLFWMLACLAACSAALVAHFAIDFVGDYLPWRDAYDFVPHASRIVALLGALGVGTVLVARFFGAAVDEALGGNRLAAAFAAVARRPAPMFVAAVAILSLIALVAMGLLDERLSGGSGTTLHELMGGSLLLGSSVTLVCGVVAGLFTRALVAWLGTARGKLVATVASWLRSRTVSFRPSYAHHDRFAPLGCTAAAVASRGGMRGPPAPHFA